MYYFENNFDDLEKVLTYSDKDVFYSTNKDIFLKYEVFRGECGRTIRLLKEVDSVVISELIIGYNYTVHNEEIFELLEPHIEELSEMEDG